MRRVSQEITSESAVAMPGDCFRACVASLLDLSLGEVPHFVALGPYWWMWAFNAWIAGRGMVYANYLARDVVPLGLHIISGVSPRDIPHAVVGDRGSIAWDPHPSGDGLLPQDDRAGNWDFMFLWGLEDERPFSVLPLEVKPEAGAGRRARNGYERQGESDATAVPEND